MINKTKDILKRKYVVPTILAERMEPWEMIAQTQGDGHGTGFPQTPEEGGHDPNDPNHEDAKRNNIFFGDDFFED